MPGEALKVLHSEEPDEAMALLRKAEILAANTSSAHGTVSSALLFGLYGDACCFLAASIHADI